MSLPPRRKTRLNPATDGTTGGSNEMALQSMTGFARARREDDAVAVVWEARSVNGRGLETRLRLPQGFERLEQPLKQRIGKRFSRGNIQASLTVSYGVTSRRPVVDEELLFTLAGLARRLQDEHGAAPARADGLLALRGVLDLPEADALDKDGQERIEALAFDAFDAALDDLERARGAEGEALKKVLEGQIGQIEALTLQAEADPARSPASIRGRLAEQLRLLLETAEGLDEARLNQEAAILAAKADIREEIDRLKTHVVAARTLLSGQGAIGRKLDFLAQELNRESNTLCSKSNASSVTAIGLELKAVVDQFREQVQNLE